jgi:hypothetical protein
VPYFSKEDLDFWHQILQIEQIELLEIMESAFLLIRIDITLMNSILDSVH